jgi:2,4-diketo-3-deoxy-L-fuconate hydrolase
MKLFRFGAPDSETPGVVLPDRRKIDVSATVRDYDQDFFASGGVHSLAKWLLDHGDQCPEVGDQIRIGPCVARPQKIVCVGVNYSRHAAESGSQTPTEPVIFLKATSSLAGPNDDIIIPRGSLKTDWEVELAVVIGRKARYVRLDQAMEYVAGYCVHNDYSERSFQLERGGQWCKGKGCDTFAPIGPVLVTRDEVPDPHNLRMWLSVNGSVRQHSNTSDLIFQVPYLVSYISQFMTLLPSDVISTGTPEGVGYGMKPPQYLKAGDIVELGIECLGQARQRLVRYEELQGASSDFQNSSRSDDLLRKDLGEDSPNSC